MHHWFKIHGVSSEWVDLFLLVELHCKGFASAPCAGGLFIKRTPQLFYKAVILFCKVSQGLIVVEMPQEVWQVSNLEVFTRISFL